MNPEMVCLAMDATLQCMQMDLHLQRLLISRPLAQLFFPLQAGADYALFARFADALMRL